MTATTTARPREAAAHLDAVTVAIGVDGGVAGNVVGLISVAGRRSDCGPPCSDR